MYDTIFFKRDDRESSTVESFRESCIGVKRQKKQ